MTETPTNKEFIMDQNQFENETVPMSTGDKIYGGVLITLITVFLAVFSPLISRIIFFPLWFACSGGQC